jgi:transposase
METKEIFSALLQLGEDWRVDSISYDESFTRVDIYISYTKKEGFCTNTGELSPVYDYRKERVWQHLPLFQYKTFLHCRIPRVKNSLGKVTSLEIPWSDSSKRYSFLFEKYIIDLLKATFNQSKTAKLANTTFDVVNRIMHSSVERGMLRRTFKKGEIVLLGIDEKAFNKGHNYISILIDLENQRIIDVEKGRDKEAAEKLITKSLSDTQRADIKAISMDMWESYMLIAQDFLPNADIVHDKFHIIKYLKDAVNSERKKEVKQEDVLKNSKYTMLKNENNLTTKQYSQFEDIMAANLKTGQAWSLAETFKEILDAKEPIQATAYFDMWIDKVKDSGLKSMQKVANTFKNHMTGIINYVIHKITNAKTERFNGKIQNLKNIARGYRTYKNFRSAILFFNGKLDLYSHRFQ